jgi:hypothetical protein
MTAGYYKLINNVLRTGLTIYGPGFTLTELDKDLYRYPNNQNGWIWFDSIDTARAVLGLPIVTPPEGYDPAKFLQDMFANANFESWLSHFSVFRQSGFLDVATNAKIDNNWAILQSVYNQYKESFPPSVDAITEWQAIADANDIPLSF